MDRVVTTAPRYQRSLPPGVWLVAAASTVLLVAVSPRYGFHRDELYFLMAGRRLDWGYPDQPPLTPIVAAAIDALPGAPTPLLLRAVPALGVGGLTLMSASMALRFGGGRWAAVLAAAWTGGAGTVLASGHLLSTTTVEFILAGAIVLVLAMLLDGAAPRWWLVLGLLAGLGMQNKYTIGAIVAALALGVLASPARRLLSSPWPWAGVCLATVVWVPNLTWQVGNGWPQLEMAAALRERSDGPVAFVALQVLNLSVVLVVPAVAGAIRLWRQARGRWRAFPIAFVALFVAVLLSGGKFYYVFPLYLPLLAAGACWGAGLAARPRRLLAGASAVAIGAFALFALPVLPTSALRVTNEVNRELGETAGWAQFVDQVQAVVDGLDPEDRRDAVIFTGSYGQAAALEVLGRTGLPPVASGHNAYGQWGPPLEHGTVVGVGWIADELAPICPSLQVAAEIDNGLDVANEEQGAPILVCQDPPAQLADVWHDLRHLN